MQHCSTVQQRSQWVSQMLVQERQHGLVSQLSRDYQVSRQTLYRWKAEVEQAIQEALNPTTAKSKRKGLLSTFGGKLFNKGNVSLIVCIKR